MGIELFITASCSDTPVLIIPCFFLEGRHIFSYYLFYVLFNIYVYEIFRYGLDLRRFLVFLVFLLPVLFSFLVFGSLNASVDFYYSFKSFRARLYVFSGLFSYRLVLKDWSMFLVIFFLYV